MVGFILLLRKGILYIFLSWMCVCHSLAHSLPAWVFDSDYHQDSAFLKELNFYAAKLGLDSSVIVKLVWSGTLNRDQDGCMSYNDTGLALRRHQVIIWINRQLDVSEQMITIAHELVHAGQYIHGKLSSDAHSFIWNGQKFRRTTSYTSRPWEKEAFAIALKLRRAFLMISQAHTII